MSVIDMKTGRLEKQTATHAVRDWVWVPGDPDNDGRIGTLTITMRKSDRYRSKEERDSYGVQDGEPIGRHGREFLLSNLTNPAKTRVYKVVIHRNGNTCDCKAGECGNNCKHRDVLADIIEKGWLEAVHPDNELWEASRG